MSLLLNCGTIPDGLPVKTYGLGDNPVFIGDYEIALRDFLAAAMYVLTNTDLLANDPRVAFVTEIRGLAVIPGYNPGGVRLGNV